MVEAETGTGGQDGQGTGTKSDGGTNAGKPIVMERSQRVCQRHTLKKGRREREEERACQRAHRYMSTC